MTWFSPKDALKYVLVSLQTRCSTPKDADLNSQEDICFLYDSLYNDGIVAGG